MIRQERQKFTFHVPKDTSQQCTTATHRSIA